jgi:hypothetical protein
LGGLVYHLINYRKIQEILWEEAKKSSKTQEIPREEANKSSNIDSPNDCYKSEAVTLAFAGFIYSKVKENRYKTQEIPREEANKSSKTQEDSQIKIKRSSRILCCMSHMAIGAAAAPPAILLLRPESAFALLAMSLVSGSAGSALFRNVQEKMLVNLLASEIEEKKEVKAEHETMRQKSLVLNEKQSEAVWQLLQIVQEHDSKSGDWDKVEQIAEELSVLCSECSQTLEASKSFIYDSKDSSTSQTQPSHFDSLKSPPVPKIGDKGKSYKFPRLKHRRH